MLNTVTALLEVFYWKNTQYKQCLLSPWNPWHHTQYPVSELTTSLCLFPISFDSLQWGVELHTPFHWSLGHKGLKPSKHLLMPYSYTLSVYDRNLFGDNNCSHTDILIRLFYSTVCFIIFHTKCIFHRKDN